MCFSSGAHGRPFEDVDLTLIWETRTRRYVCCRIIHCPKPNSTFTISHSFSGSGIQPSRVVLAQHLLKLHSEFQLGPHHLKA